ncbi:MAG: hypothetical protein V1881_03255 [Candidatus Micrarchaeota archaeon]
MAVKTKIPAKELARGWLRPSEGRKSNARNAIVRNMLNRMHGRDAIVLRNILNNMHGVENESPLPAIRNRTPKEQRIMDRAIRTLSSGKRINVDKLFEELDRARAKTGKKKSAPT